MPSWVNTSLDAPGWLWAVLVKMAVYLPLFSRREGRVLSFPSKVWTMRE
jgi:hypothetical protein